MEHKSLTLGEVLDGDRMALSMYEVKFGGTLMFKTIVAQIKIFISVCVDLQVMKPFRIVTCRIGHRQGAVQGSAQREGLVSIPRRSRRLVLLRIGD